MHCAWFQLRPCLPHIAAAYRRYELTLVRPVAIARKYTPMAGCIQIGRWCSRTSLLRRGSSGFVQLAQHLPTQQLVAIKFLRRGATLDPRLIAREVRATMQGSAGHVVGARAAAVTGSQPISRAASAEAGCRTTSLSP